MGRSTRERILQAGLKLFSERGYLGATTREIASEASVAEITLFRYFPSKERLFEEVINTYSFLPRLKEIIAEVEDKSLKEALIRIATSFLEVLNMRKDLIRIMHSEMMRYPEKIQKIYDALIRDTLKILSTYFEGLQRKGIMRGVNPEYAARAFLGMFFSYFYVREIKGLKRYMEDNTKDIIEAYVDIFINGTIKKVIESNTRNPVEAGGLRIRKVAKER